LQTDDMKYAAEVINLLAAYPGHGFGMREIVRSVAKGLSADNRKREQIRKGVARVLERLQQAGLAYTSRRGSRQYPVYIWHKNNPASPKPRMRALPDKQLKLF